MGALRLAGASTIAPIEEPFVEPVRRIGGLGVKHRDRVRVPSAIAGYDATRPVNHDFSRPRGWQPALRRARRPAPVAHERTTYMFEGDCLVCEREFTRRISITDEEPVTCSVQCAAVRRGDPRDHDHDED